MHMHVLDQKNYVVSASRVSSGRRSRRLDQVPFGKRERRRPWARSHAGRASCSLAAPASVKRTSFSRRSSPRRMATQPASIRRRRLRVSVVSSRDVSPPRSRWRTSPVRLRRRSSEYWVVRRPTPRSSSSYSRLTARVAWRRALQRQGVAAGLCRSLLMLDVYTGYRQLSRGASGNRRAADEKQIQRRKAPGPCARRSDTPTRPPGSPLALCRLDRLSCCRTLFATERLSPSARERVRQTRRDRVHGHLPV